MIRNMAYTVAKVGGRPLFLALHTKAPPSEEEWRGWTSLLEERAKSLDWDLAKAPNLVLTDGGAPTTAQRTVVNVLIAQAKTMPPVALVTDATVVRAIIRAFSIFNPRIRAFSPKDIVEAASHLGLRTDDMPALITACVDLERDGLGVGSVETLSVLKRLAPR